MGCYTPPSSGLLILKSLHLASNGCVLGFTNESHYIVVVCSHFPEKYEEKTSVSIQDIFEYASLKANNDTIQRYISKNQQ